MSLKFAVQLLDKNIVSKDQFIDLVRQHESSCLPSMAVAISQNFISIRQAQQILELQIERPELSFEQAAREFGILSLEKCQQIATAQESTRRSVEQIAIDNGICTKDQIELGKLPSAKSADEPKASFPTPKFSRRKSRQMVDALVKS